jgi:biopolymer transport protein ExbB
MRDIVTQILQRGGIPTWIIFCMGTIALIITLARLLHFHRAQIHVSEFMRGVMNVLRRGNALEAISICDETPGPIAHILRAAILNCSRGEDRMQQAVQDASLSEVPRLEKWIRGLYTIASISILLGLLGTIIGLIKLMDKMQSVGVVDITNMAPDMWSALISTATGLIVGIGAVAAYDYFVARVDSIVLDMEKAATEIIHFLIENKISIEDQTINPPEEES